MFSDKPQESETPLWPFLGRLILMVYFQHNRGVDAHNPRCYTRPVCGESLPERKRSGGSVLSLGRVFENRNFATVAFRWMPNSLDVTDYLPAL